MTKLDHVKARFGGHDLTFKIDRANLSIFESFGRKTAFTRFQETTTGRWSIDDLKLVLNFALMSASTIAWLNKLDATPGFDMAWINPSAETRAASKAEHRTNTESPIVDAALAKNPPGMYVPLVQSVLAAALLGIDEADAVFTDEADGA